MLHWMSARWVRPGDLEQQGFGRSFYFLQQTNSHPLRHLRSCWWFVHRGSEKFQFIFIFVLAVSQIPHWMKGFLSDRPGSNVILFDIIMFYDPRLYFLCADGAGQWWTQRIPCCCWNPDSRDEPWLGWYWLSVTHLLPMFTFSSAC